MCSFDRLYITTTNPSPLQVLSRGVALSSATAILLDVLLARLLIGLKLLYLRAVHVLHHLICLPFLEAET